MRLSMSMIHWYMRDFSQIPKIECDICSIRGLRFLSGDTAQMKSDFMYLGNASDYFSDDRYHKAFIVVHQRNYIIFLNEDFENLLNGLLSAFDYFGEWEHRMLDASASRFSLQKIIDLSCEVLCNPVTVMDMEGNTIALSSTNVPEDDLYWKYKEMEGREHPAILAEQWFTPEGVPIKELSVRPQVVQNVQKGQSPLIMMYLMQENEPVAVFYILVVDQDLLTMNIQIADEICKYLILSQEFYDRNAQLRSTENLLAGFLDGRLDYDSEGEAAAAKLRKSVGEGQWRLVLLHFLERSDRIYLRSMLHEIKYLLKMPCLLYQDQLVFLITESRQKEILNLLESVLSFSTTGIAMSMPAADFFSMPIRYEQALFTIEQAGGRAGIYHCEDFAHAYLKNEIKRLIPTERYLHPAFSMLEEYDQANHTDLRSTLTVFLKKQCNVLETANVLHVHRNTVKYRITRILEITGIDLEDEEELAYLHLSDWLSR